MKKTVDSSFNKLNSLVYYDIGAYGGLVEPFDKRKKRIYLKKYVGIDPRFNEHYKKKDKYIYYDYAISDKEEEKLFYITRDGQNSSLFIPDMEYYDINDGDYNNMMVINSKLVSCKRLENIIKKEDDKIDILKMDVQGSEYNILKSLSYHINKILVIHLEMWLEKCYKDVPLLFLVHNFLISHSFFPARIINRRTSKWREMIYLNILNHEHEKMSLVKNLYKINESNMNKAMLEINKCLSNKE